MKMPVHPQSLNVVRNMRVLYFLILFFPTLSFGQGKKENLEFALVFGACFKHDSIDVKIQDFSVFSGRVRSSLVSKANLSITQRGKFVVSFHDGKTKNYKKVKTTPLLKLEFVVNGKWYLSSTAIGEAKPLCVILKQPLNTTNNNEWKAY
jgi:hypothetical protein